MHNIGVIVARFTKTLGGLLCKHCITSNFWSYTLTALFLGWWGVISSFYTPVTIATNLVHFIGSRRLPD